MTHQLLPAAGRRNSLRPFAWASISLLLLLACNPLSTVAQPPDVPWPTETWQRSAPIDQGMDIETLESFYSVASRHIDTVLVIRNGWIVFERNASSFDDGSRHFLFSTTKSILSILIGIAIDHGFIESVDEPVMSFFPDHVSQTQDPLKSSITLKHLLTMSSGLDCPEDGNETFLRMSGSWNSLEFALELPMAGAPGEVFQYCNANSHILSCVLTETTGLSALAFAQAHLFGPLGIEDVRWGSDPQGNSLGCTGLWMTPRDLAKLGLLLLEDGRWEGEQIVSADWIEASVQPHTTSHDHGYRGGYGYQWWIGAESDGWFFTSGYQGQHLFVLPNQDLVVVFMGSYDYANNEIYERLVRHQLLPALDGPTLAEQIESLTSLEPNPVPALPETARTVSGQRYALGPHSYLFETITLAFEEGNDEATFSFRRYGLDYEFAVGMDSVWRVNTAMGPDVRQYRALRGEWIEERTFRIEQIDLDWGESWEILLTFEGDHVHILFGSLPGTGSLRFETTGAPETPETPASEPNP